MCHQNASIKCVHWSNLVQQVSQELNHECLYVRSTPTTEEMAFNGYITKVCANFTKEDVQILIFNIKNRYKTIKHYGIHDTEEMTLKKVKNKIKWALRYKKYFENKNGCNCKVYQLRDEI